MLLDCFNKENYLSCVNSKPHIKHIAESQNKGLMYSHVFAVNMKLQLAAD